MNVVRDLLDKLVRDRNGREMGRVDALLLETHEGAPPRLTALLIGPQAIGSRVHPALGRMARAIEQACGIESGRPVRIPLSAVTRIGKDIHVDRSLAETAADAVERRIRRWVTRIPGADR